MLDLFTLVCLTKRRYLLEILWPLPWDHGRQIVNFLTFVDSTSWINIETYLKKTWYIVNSRYLPQISPSPNKRVSVRRLGRWKLILPFLNVKNYIQSFKLHCVRKSSISAVQSQKPQVSTRNTSLRMDEAGVAYRQFRERLWRNRHVTTRTKCKVYRALVLSTLLYGAETWTIYQSQVKELLAFLMCHLREI